jgi:hypothetical protein
LASTTELTGEVIVSDERLPRDSTPRTAPLMIGAPLLWSVVTTPPSTTASEFCALPCPEMAIVACSSRAPIVVPVALVVLVLPIAVDAGATR